METWGELFWDAWIRLRLSCRRLYRTYWPPRFKAWQVCTVTGIISIILTLVVLNLPSDTSELQAKNEDQTQASKGKKSTTGTTKASLAVATDDPFADAELTSASSAPVEDEFAPPAQAESFESDVEEPIAKRPLRTEVAFNEFPDAEAVDQVPAADENGVHDPRLPPRAVETDEPTLASEATESAMTRDEPPTELEAQPFEESDSTLPTETEQPSVEETSEAMEEAPEVGLPDRDPGHYGRLGDHEDSEEDRHSVRNIRPTPLKDLPPPKQHTPFITPIQPKSHYSRLGSHEDSEEKRHSIRDIRPTRTDNVPTVSAKEIVPVLTADPGVPAATEASALPPEPNELSTSEAAPAEETGPPSEEPGLDLTPAVPVPAEPRSKPEPPPEELALPVQTSDESEMVEPVDSVPPPVLFAPDEAAPPEVAEPAGPKDVEYHGPVKSTKPTDHEAHEDEDAFSRPPRKSSPTDWPVAKVVPPIPDVASPVDEEAAERTERRKPVDGVDDAGTTSSTTPQHPIITVTPRIIIQSEEELVGVPASETENPHLDEDRVIPKSVTRRRGPDARITVPDRMPPVDSPEPVEPLEQHDSEFAPVVRPPAPRLMMEITGPRQAPVGTQVVLHFKLQNTGTAPATGIVVTDVLPPGLQHRLSPDLEYTVARLMPGETRETNLTVQCVSRGTIINKAILHADGDVTSEAEIQLEVTDPSPGTSAPSRPTPSPLALKHHGPERWLVDSTGQFLMTVTNTTDQPLRNVTITQSYPPGTNLVHATVGHKTDVKNRTVSWTISEFAPGVSYILETELHSLTNGPATSIARIKIGDREVAEDRWTAVSLVTLAP